VLAGGEYKRAWADLRCRNSSTRLIALSFLPTIGVMIVVTSCTYVDIPDDLGTWVVEAGLPHSLALAFIDAVFAVHAANIIFLTGARSPAGPCALVATYLCGPAVGLHEE